MGDYQMTVTAVLTKDDTPRVERLLDEVLVHVEPEITLAFEDEAVAIRWAAALVTALCADPECVGATRTHQ